MEQQVEEAIGKYVAPQKFTTWALETLKETNDDEEKRRNAILAQLRKRLTEVEQQIDALLRLKISPNNQNGELLSDEEYLEKKKSLISEKMVLKEKIGDIEQNASNWLERCEQFFNFAVHCEEKWIYGTPDERKLIVSLMFGTNSVLLDKKLLIKAKKPFIETVSLANLSNWRE